MIHKTIIRAVSCAGIIFCLIMVYILAMKLPAQELKITTQTEAEEYDLSGQTSLYWFGSADAGMPCKAIIKLMAVPDTSDSLFTHFGTGQYVYLGCSELKAEYEFISLGRFIKVRLKLNAAQTDLKLEDGTPFDITRYSLRPVLSIER